MRGVARLGDDTHGICYCHDEPREVGGKIISASSTVFANGRAVARHGDIVQSDCGHEARIIVGKSTHTADGKLVARLGDEFDGCYVGRIVSASTDKF